MKTNFQITLRAARENCFLTIAEVSAKTHIPVRTIKRYEVNCFSANIISIMKLLQLYGISLNHIHCGKESEALDNLRKDVV
jgi:predicted transcriptional regulator